MPMYDCLQTGKVRTVPVGTYTRLAKHQQFPLVYAGDEIFAPLEPLHVPAIETMDEALHNWDQHGGPGEFLGPLTPPETAPLQPGTTEIVHVRHSMYLPPFLAAILINRDLRPRQAWQELGGQILAKGLRDAHTDILAWLRIANIWKGPNPLDPMDVLPGNLLPSPRPVCHSSQRSHRQIHSHSGSQGPGTPSLSASISSLAPLMP
jgi:hypothetical protein